MFKFFATEAWERRARARERRKLVGELGDLENMASYIRARLPMLSAQLSKLARADSDADLEAGRLAMLDGLRGALASPGLHMQQFGRIKRAPTISQMVEDDACLGGVSK